jgi:hypothetical protein
VIRIVVPLLLAALAQAQSSRLLTMPEAVSLSGPEARQQLLAQLETGSVQEDVTAKAQWASSNPAVATVDEKGVITPKANGVVTVTARHGGLAAKAIEVRVADMDKPFAWSFRNHVIPVMTKMGCNQGACHGALAGKNGFKLTLRGYDPDVDYDTLTRASAARRVTLADPPASLILQKATFGIPHGGGRRFTKTSLEYRVIEEWIANGAPPPSANDAQVQSLEVFPKSAILKPGAEQQVIVRAKYSDGREADVTRWVKFSTSNEGVAGVDDWGKAKMNGAGEAAITIWYASKVAYARLMVPFANEITSSSYSSFKPNGFIDELILAKWKALKLAPSGSASDAVFVRRAYLDAAGVLPTSEEVETFLADKSADKRAKLIDRLLERDEYVDYWAYKWSDLLLVSSRKLRTASMWSFYNWIRDSVKENKPWDRFVRDIFTSTGSTAENGALNYFVLHKDPIGMAENVTQAFLGQRITCARCHNHPLEKWTQTQYYQMANLFSRVGVKNGTDGDSVVFAKASGEVLHPRLLRPLAPTPLDGTSMALDSTGDRRIHLANWLTSPSNQMFSRTIVNRVWANFFGRGIVDPVDDLRATNPASNEELLAALSKDFVANGYDVKRLIKQIMNSAAYQLSSEANATNQQDNIYYSKYIVKRLPAEVILDAMSQVTGVPTPFSGYPAGTRALQLPDSLVASQFLTSFGRPPRQLCDSGERSADPTVTQALHVINGDTLNKKLSAADGNLALLSKIGLSDRRIVEQLYLSAMSRYPTDAEVSALQESLAKARQVKGSVEVQREARQQALEDALWALLVSKEFMFNY